MSEKNKNVNGLKRGRWLMPFQYKISELVVIIGFGETKICQFIKEGRLKSYKIDGTVFVHRAEAIRFIEDHRNDNNFTLAS